MSGRDTCSFCREKKTPIITGPDPARICADCVNIAARILKEHTEEEKGDV